MNDVIFTSFLQYLETANGPVNLFVILQCVFCDFNKGHYLRLLHELADSNIDL